MESSVLTVMFTDVVGSVKMYTKVSDTVAVDIVRKLERQVQDLMPKYRGKFIKSTGDGQLLTFEDAPSAVKCAHEIHRICATLARENMNDLFVRIAAHTGEVLHGDGDIHGNTVNLSARLLGVVGASETCVTAESWAAMSDGEKQGFVPHGPEMFKGFTKYSFVFKKPNAAPMSDVTLRPDQSAEEETTMMSAERMPRHPRYVLVLEHPQMNKTIDLKEGETHIVGRAPECHTVIPDRMFSGTHAAFAVVEGVLWVFDLQSANGINYRGRRIKRRKPIDLNSVVQLPTGTMLAKLP